MLRNDIGKAAYRASFDSDIESDDEKIKKTSAAAGKAVRLCCYVGVMPSKKGADMLRTLCRPGARSKIGEIPCRPRLLFLSRAPEMLYPV